MTTSLPRPRWRPSDAYNDRARWLDEEDGGDRWRSHAACLDADPTLFFPVDRDGNEPSVAPPEAKVICHRCPVAGKCLETYIDEEFGVFAATTGYERRIMTKKIVRKHCPRTSCRSTDVVKHRSQRKEVCLACGWSWDIL